MAFSSYHIIYRWKRHLTNAIENFLTIRSLTAVIIIPFERIVRTQLFSLECYWYYANNFSTYYQHGAVFVRNPHVYQIIICVVLVISPTMFLFFIMCNCPHLQSTISFMIWISRLSNIKGDLKSLTPRVNQSEYNDYTTIESISNTLIRTSLSGVTYRIQIERVSVLLEAVCACLVIYPASEILRRTVYRSVTYRSHSIP